MKLSSKIVIVCVFQLTFVKIIICDEVTTAQKTDLIEEQLPNADKSNENDDTTNSTITLRHDSNAEKKNELIEFYNNSRTQLDENLLKMLNKIITKKIKKETRKNTPHSTSKNLKPKKTLYTENIYNNIEKKDEEFNGLSNNKLIKMAIITTTDTSEQVIQIPYFNETSSKDGEKAITNEYTTEKENEKEKMNLSQNFNETMIPNVNNTVTEINQSSILQNINPVNSPKVVMRSSKLKTKKGKVLRISRKKSNKAKEDQTETPKSTIKIQKEESEENSKNAKLEKTTPENKELQLKQNFNDTETQSEAEAAQITKAAENLMKISTVLQAKEEKYFTDDESTIGTGKIKSQQTNTEGTKLLTKSEQLADKFMSENHNINETESVIKMVTELHEGINTTQNSINDQNSEKGEALSNIKINTEEYKLPSQKLTYGFTTENSNVEQTIEHNEKNIQEKKSKLSLELEQLLDEVNFNENLTEISISTTGIKSKDINTEETETEKLVTSEDPNFDQTKVTKATILEPNNNKSIQGEEAALRLQTDQLLQEEDDQKTISNSNLEIETNTQESKLQLDYGFTSETLNFNQTEVPRILMKTATELQSENIQEGGSHELTMQNLNDNETNLPTQLESKEINIKETEAEQLIYRLQSENSNVDQTEVPRELIKTATELRPIGNIEKTMEEESKLSLQTEQLSHELNETEIESKEINTEKTDTETEVTEALIRTATILELNEDKYPQMEDTKSRLQTEQLSHKQNSNDEQIERPKSNLKIETVSSDQNETNAQDINVDHTEEEEIGQLSLKFKIQNSNENQTGINIENKESYKTSEEAYDLISQNANIDQPKVLVRTALDGQTNGNEETLSEKEAELNLQTEQFPLKFKIQNSNEDRTEITKYSTDVEIAKNEESFNSSEKAYDLISQNTHVVQPEVSKVQPNGNEEKAELNLQTEQTDHTEITKYSTDVENATNKESFNTSEGAYDLFSSNINVDQTQVPKVLVRTATELQLRENKEETEQDLNLETLEITTQNFNDDQIEIPYSSVIEESETNTQENVFSNQEEQGNPNVPHYLTENLKINKDKNESTQEDDLNVKLPKYINQIEKAINKDNKNSTDDNNILSQVEQIPNENYSEDQTKIPQSSKLISQEKQLTDDENIIVNQVPEIFLRSFKESVEGALEISNKDETETHTEIEKTKFTTENYNVNQTKGTAELKIKEETEVNEQLSFRNKNYDALEDILENTEKVQTSDDYQTEKNSKELSRKSHIKNVGKTIKKGMNRNLNISKYQNKNKGIIDYLKSEGLGTILNNLHKSTKHTKTENKYQKSIMVKQNSHFEEENKYDDIKHILLKILKTNEDILIESIQRQIQLLIDDNDILKKNIHREEKILERSLDNKETEISNLKMELENLETDFKSLDKLLENVPNELKYLESKLSSINVTHLIRVDNLEHKLVKLEEKLDRVSKKDILKKSVPLRNKQYSKNEPVHQKKRIHRYSHKTSSGQ